jgi:hypothetical protein
MHGLNNGEKSRKQAARGKQIGQQVNAGAASGQSLIHDGFRRDPTPIQPLTIGPLPSGQGG